jgi:Fe-S cluster biogenesis protein NfuA
VTTENGSFQERMRRVEGLVQAAEQLPGPEAQAVVRELTAALLELHAEGLARMLELASASVEAFGRDGLVGSLLLLHGLHPDDLETRIVRALDQVRPFLRSHGGDVEILALADGAVRLRLTGNCHGCPSSTATMKSTIEEAICAAAPDVTLLEVEGVAELPAPRRTTISLPLVAERAYR